MECLSNKHLSQSVEISHRTIDLKADNHKTLPTQNPKLGYILMLGYVLQIILFKFILNK